MAHSCLSFDMIQLPGDWTLLRAAAGGAEHKGVFPIMFCYMPMLIATVALLTFSVNSAIAEELIMIDAERILQIADHAVYLENEEFAPGDLERESDHLLVHCHPDESQTVRCFTSVSFLIVSSRLETFEEAEYGMCMQKVYHDEVKVTVYADGSYVIHRGGGGTSGHGIDCGLIPLGT